MRYPNRSCFTDIILITRFTLLYTTYISQYGDIKNFNLIRKLYIFNNNQDRMCNFLHVETKTIKDTVKFIRVFHHVNLRRKVKHNHTTMNTPLVFT